MKSLVEEASSIAKAIEKAWERAGKPQSFSVKVYETPEKNFFGFTKKSAKVGIFFEEEVQKRAHDRNPSKPQHQKPHNPNYRNHDSAPSERDNRQNNNSRFQSSRNDEDRKARHQSNPVKTESTNNDTRSESAPHEQRNHEQQDRSDRNRSESRNNNRPHQQNNNRRPHQQDRPTRGGSRFAQDSEKQQPMVSSLPFVEENEPTTPSTAVVNPVQVQMPLTQPAPQAAPISQSQRKVLKVSGRMYTRPKTQDDSDKK